MRSDRSRWGPWVMKHILTVMTLFERGRVEWRVKSEEYEYSWLHDRRTWLDPAESPDLRHWTVCLYFLLFSSPLHLHLLSSLVFFFSLSSSIYLHHGLLILLLLLPPCPAPSGIGSTAHWFMRRKLHPNRYQSPTSICSRQMLWAIVIHLLIIFYIPWFPL